MNNKKILLIDGNSLFFKSFYGTYFRLKQGYERGKNNEPINAVRLFALMIINLRKKNPNSKVVVAFDEQNPNTYRHKYDFYKSKRKKQPDELYEQIFMVKEFLDLYGIKWIANKNYEADDLIGIIAQEAKDKSYKVNIITSDKDLLQLVDFNVNVNISKIGVSDLDNYNNNNFYDKFHNLSPQQVPDLKGIAGDNSDNLKGINGIGEKGAIKLLQKYDSLEEVINNSWQLSKSLQEKIEKGKEEAIISKKLAKIITNGDFEINFNDFEIKKTNKKELFNFLEEKNLFNVIRKINQGE